MVDTGSLRVLQGSPGHSEAPSSSSVVSCNDFLTFLGARGVVLGGFGEHFRRIFGG